MFSGIQEVKVKFQLAVFCIFAILLVMICIYMIKMIVSMQFLLSLEMFKIIGFDLEHDKMSMN